MIICLSNKRHIVNNHISSDYSSITPVVDGASMYIRWSAALFCVAQSLVLLALFSSSQPIPGMAIHIYGVKLLVAPLMFIMQMAVSLILNNDH